MKLLKKRTGVLLLMLMSAVFFTACVKPGCKDKKACNYDQKANRDDGTCTYSQIYYEDKDGDGWGTGLAMESCEPMPGYVTNNHDIDDEEYTEDDGVGEEVLVVQEVQRVMAFLGSGVDCGACGSGGKTYLKNATDDYSRNEVVVVKAQLQTYMNTTSYSIANHLETVDGASLSGIPQYGIFSAGVDSLDGGGLGSAGATDLLDETASNANTSSPEVGVAAKASIVDGSISIDCKAKFFETLSDEFFINAFVLENGLMWEQIGSGTDDPIPHDFVVRGNASASLVGESLGTSFSAEQEFMKNFTVDLDSEWNSDNLAVLVVVWKDVGGSKMPWNFFYSAVTN